MGNKAMGITVLLSIIVCIGFLILLASYNSREGHIYFTKRITTSLDMKEMWEELMVSFQDSTKSRLWPNKFSVLTSHGLKKNARITVVYSIFFMKKTVTYTITDYRPLHGFTYSANEDHPLTGGATIEIIEDTPHTVLSWSGHYSFKGISCAALFFKYYYQKRFFRALENTMKALEAGGKVEKNQKKGA